LVLASNSWHRCNTVKVQALQCCLRRAIRLGQYTADDPTTSQLVDDNELVDNERQSLREHS